MKYMIIERFKPGLKQQVYERYERHGRMLPAGVPYLDSWLSADETRYYQLMEADDPPLLESWTKNWDDLIDFETPFEIRLRSWLRRVPQAMATVPNESSLSMS